MAVAESQSKDVRLTRSYLTQLPNEILVEILTQVAVPKITNPSLTRCLAGNYTARPLIYVCRRFYHLAVPLLYSSFASTGADLDFLPPSDVVTNLHRTLVTRPDLGRYCTTLSIYISDINGRESDPPEWKRAYEFLTLLPNVRSFTLHGGFERYPSKNWELLKHATQCMPKIEALGLTRECFNLSLRTFFRQEIDFARIKSLTVNGFSNGWPTSATELVLEPNQIGASALTSLHILDFTGRVSALRQLLLWPKALQHFSFMNRSASGSKIRLSEFASILAQHKSTLKSISLVNLLSNARTIIDVTDFPYLQELTIDVYAVEFDADEAASCLLAPKLRKVTFTFSRWDFRPKLWDLSWEFVDFVRGFCVRAIERKSALCEIYIDFDPEWTPGYDGASEDVEEFSWERLERVREEVEPRGFVLEWTEPPGTKEEMLRLSDAALEKARKEREAAELEDRGMEAEDVGHISA